MKKIKMDRCKDCKSIKSTKKQAYCTNPSIVALYIKDKRIAKGSKVVVTNPKTRACRFFRSRKEQSKAVPPQPMPKVESPQKQWFG